MKEGSGGVTDMFTLGTTEILVEVETGLDDATYNGENLAETAS